MIKTVKCIICGMKINQNNFNFNASTLIEKNTEKNIKYCPFCGVDASYLVYTDEIYQINSDNLTDQELEILDHAVKLEIFNSEFYKEACQLAKDNILSYLLKELSRIEFMHARIHKNLGGFDSFPTLHKPDYSRLDSDILLLDEATKREHHAIEFYKKKSTLVSSPIIKKVFKALSDVERQHEVITQDNKKVKKRKYNI